MDVVFPGCLTSVSFLNALIYSVVQAANSGNLSTEGLKLQGAAIRNLIGSMTTSKNGLGYSEIGAIMILQGVAVSACRLAGRRRSTDYTCSIDGRTPVLTEPTHKV